MPFFGLGMLYIVAAIFFAVHAVRSGQSIYWLLILFMFPLLGSVVYLFAVYLPGMRYSRGARTARMAVGQVINPGRELRDARRAFDLTPTVDRRLRLAQALMAAGEAADALAHYRAAASGPFARDAAVLSGLAQAHLACSDPAGCALTLELLFEVRTEARRQADLSLLYARALAEAGRPGVREAFEAALTVASGPEAKCRYADWLVAHNDATDARPLYEDIVRDSRHWHSHAHAINRNWLQRAQSALARP